MMPIFLRTNFQIVLLFLLASFSHGRDFVQLHEEVVFALEDADTAREHSHLRRELQGNQFVCRASTPVFYGDGGCDSLPDYPCTCTGSLASKTMCSYCPEVVTAKNKICQQAGMSTTYYDVSDRIMKTCSCNYDLSTGAIKQDCHLQEQPDTPPLYPTPAPPTTTTTIAPVVDKADDPVPSPGIPTPPSPAITCRPDPAWAYNFFACMDSFAPDFCDRVQLDCNALHAKYPCSCTDSDQTLCSYCKVRTADAVICQVTGNTMRFVTPDNTTDQCTCVSTADGGAKHVCTSSPLPPPPPPVVPPPVVPPPVVPPPATAPPTADNRGDTPGGDVPVPPPANQLVCRPVTPMMPQGGNCGSLPDYPCTCTGSLASKNMCSYCPDEVVTAKLTICQQAGMSTTYYDKSDGLMKTCSCNYDLTGAIKQDCHVQGQAQSFSGIEELP